MSPKAGGSFNTEITNQILTHLLFQFIFSVVDGQWVVVSIQTVYQSLESKEEDDTSNLPQHKDMNAHHKLTPSLAQNLYRWHQFLLTAVLKRGFGMPETCFEISAACGKAHEVYSKQDVMQRFKATVEALCHGCPMMSQEQWKGQHAQIKAACPMVTSVAETAGPVVLFTKESHLLPLHKTSVELLANPTPAWLLLQQHTLWILVKTVTSTPHLMRQCILYIFKLKMTH